MTGLDTNTAIMNEALVIPDELVQAFFQRRVVLFLSAGCSIPSDIPAAPDLTAIITRSAYAYLGKGESFAQFNTRLFGSTTPTLEEVAEYFLQRDGSLRGFLDLIPFSEWSKPPNEAHEGVARLAKEGFLDVVLTTNWDQLVEVACYNADCRHVPVRKREDLSKVRPDQLTLYKIHGCMSDPDSIIAASSQIDPPEGHEDLLCLAWARPQLYATFQSRFVVFIGYSGSVDKISTTMAGVANWSAPGTRHYVVDKCSWVDFFSQARDFAEAIHLTEEKFFDSGAQQFVVALVDCLVQCQIRKITAQTAPTALLDLLILADQPNETLTLVGDLSNALSSGTSSELFLRALRRKVNGIEAISANERALARVIAWASYLSNRGWSIVRGLPLMRKGDRWVYFAAGENGEAAKRRAMDVVGFLKDPHGLQRLISGDGTRLDMTCVLLFVSGDVGRVTMRDLTNDDSPDDLTRGYRSGLRFCTESEFLQKVVANG